MRSSISGICVLMLAMLMAKEVGAGAKTVAWTSEMEVAVVATVEAEVAMAAVLSAG